MLEETICGAGAIRFIKRFEPGFIVRRSSEKEKANDIVEGADRGATLGHLPNG
jgi:hypothetical protein